MCHLPTKSVSTPKITWVDCPKLEPPTDLPDDEEKDVTIIGETNFRNMKSKYGIRPDDRRRHVYIIGKTGMGKSTMLENMIFSDIQAGKGVAVIDPHGDLAEAVMRFVPKSRTNDVILFDPADREFPVAFNLLEGKNAEQRGLVASGLIGVIKKLNIDSWGPRLEHFLRNTILALVEAPDTTMLGITRMLVDKDYRYKVLHYVQDPMIKSFWQTEFSALAPQKLAEAVGPIQNKVGQFLSAPVIRNIVGQPKSTLDLRFAMDTGKIVIANLSKGKLGEDNSSMLGSLLITKFQLDAMSRADIPEKDRKDFYLYVDEFQNFATDSFSTILSEARKYKLNLTMANQYIAQMSEEVAAAVFGNVGSLVSFQVGIDDAKIFSEQFDEERVLPINIASIPKYQVYNRIMVDGLTSPVFSGNTLRPPEIHDEEPPEVRIEKIRNFSRQRYAKPRSLVEEKISRWTRPEDDKRKKKDDKKEDQKKDEKKTTTPEKKVEKK
ncbi:type IV secretion system DNA-binding domain-containing protein [bacterium]|nr:type IV secretion system DNA-binding domain-containing protein [bacterium]MBT6832056.1 type IV secretion system DNA-binding domain-containing protein [bacterium]MBT6995837.1 type IV secretion system DNA-binding domain-containing protein [bacterium]MBT7772352.1 type IV secretion system DNA-binding domain-containing protein [bacterium]